MKTIWIPFIFIALIVVSNGFLHSKKFIVATKDDDHVLSTVKIYSNLAEIIQPLGKLPLEFSHNEWNNIRTDSITLVGSNVSIARQTITEKKQLLSTTGVYVRSPSSTNSQSKFIKAILIDESRNLVKAIDQHISKEPIYFTVLADHIVYGDEPPQSKYYVDFTYTASNNIYVSYLRSNLNWKTRYQLNLFDESKNSILIAMADIRNDGISRVDIEHAELLGGDINLQMHQKQYFTKLNSPSRQAAYAESADYSMSADPPFISEGEEIAGLYVFAIKQPFSIDAKTNYILPMFQPQITVERYGSISKYFYGPGNLNGKASRSYRLSSDRFLSRGNCIIREFDRLVGETSLPDIAAKNKHEFSIGQDADIVYKEKATLISSYTYNVTISSYGRIQTRTKSTYEINLSVRNYKKTGSVTVEYQQHLHGNSVKLHASSANVTHVGSTIKYKTIITASDEEHLSYKVEITN